MRGWVNQGDQGLSQEATGPSAACMLIKMCACGNLAASCTQVALVCDQQHHRRHQPGAAEGEP